ncbi:VOC family protein [Flagellimonas sp.]|uniref:VOC family protein n=1 Tax=Flagellimonas sp. TaxID=2058762 RepID=UPI003B51449B
MKARNIYLEHANITVNDIQEAINFFQTAFPHFKIRGGGNETREWVHFGDDYTYIAINQAQYSDLKVGKNYDKVGINHIGFVVEDVEEIANNLLNAGYKRDYPKEVEQFRIRDYFADADGNQFEFVQYLSELPEERNSDKKQVTV